MEMGKFLIDLISIKIFLKIKGFWCEVGTKSILWTFSENETKRKRIARIEPTTITLWQFASNSGFDHGSILHFRRMREH